MFGENEKKSMSQIAQTHLMVLIYETDVKDLPANFLNN